MDTPHDEQHESDGERPWFRSADLADRLGVTDRTLRKMAVRGELERVRVGGAVLYREALRPEAVDRPTGPEEGSGPVAPAVDALRLALVELQRDHAATVERLTASLMAARVEAEVRAGQVEAARGEVATIRREAELVAQVAAERAERQLAEAVDRAERTAGALAAAQARASTERRRRELLEAAASLPWYAVRRRRELLEAARRGEVLALEAPVRQ
jgi:hypothetical protein